MNNLKLFQESEKKFITMTNSDKDKQEEENKEEESNEQKEESDNKEQEQESDEEESDNKEQESDDQQEEESDNEKQEESDNEQEESDDEKQEESDNEQEEESDNEQESDYEQEEESDDQQEEYEDELNYKKQILKSFCNYLEVVIKSIDDKKHNKKIINKLYYIVDIYYKNNYNKDTELIKIFNTNQINLKKKENNIFEFFINKTIDINKRLIKAEDITNSILYLNNFTTTTLFF